MKKGKSGLLLVSLVEYLIREEIETLWNFLRVVGGFPPPWYYDLPSLCCPQFFSHTQRERARSCWCLGTLWYLWQNQYIQGFRYLAQVTLIPFPTWLVLEYPFSFVPEVWWYSYNLSSSPGVLPNRSGDWVWKWRKAVWFVTSGVSGYELLLHKGAWTRQGKVFVYSNHHDLCKPVSKSD